MQSDLQLLDAWRSGAAEAGEALLSRHFDRLVRFFFNKVHEAEHEDLIQRTLLACVEGRDRFRGEASFRTFLFAVARNQLRMYLRRQRSGPPVDLSVSSLADLDPGLSTAAARAQEQALLLDALRRLPVDTQLMLELHYWEGLEAAELAEMFEVNPTTVRTRLHRARQQLKAEIERLEAKPELREAAMGGFETWALRVHESSRAGP